MAERAERPVPWWLWPFYAVWLLVSRILAVTGRLLCGVLGLVLLVLGVALTLSVVGAPLGVPFAVLGFLLVLRALF
jgi:hypothetical protein